MNKIKEFLLAAFDGRLSDFKLDTHKTGLHRILDSSEAKGHSLWCSSIEMTKNNFEDGDTTRKMKSTGGEYDKGTSRAHAAADHARQAVQVVAAAVARRASLAESSSIKGYGGTQTSHPEAMSVMETRRATVIERNPWIEASWRRQNPPTSDHVKLCLLQRRR